MINSPHLVPRMWKRYCSGRPDPGFCQDGCNQDNTVIVSGIGCSSRASGYLDFNTLHTTHGRALAFAGIKFARPELKVFVLMGDVMPAQLSGNHLIHAARRNIDLGHHFQQ